MDLNLLSDNHLGNKLCNFNMFSTTITFNNNKQTNTSSHKFHKKLRCTRLLLPLIVLTVNLVKLQTVKFYVDFNDPHRLSQLLLVYRINSCTYPKVNNPVTVRNEHITMRESIVNDLVGLWRSQRGGSILLQ